MGEDKDTALTRGPATREDQILAKLLEYRISLDRELFRTISGLIVPDGYVVVPKEATTPMWRAAQQFSHDLWSHQVEAIWEAMLEVSALAPAKPEHLPKGA